MSNNIDWERLKGEVKKLGRGHNKILAGRLGKSEAWVSRVLKQNRGLSLADFQLLCEALKIKPGSLFELTPQKTEGQQDETFEEMVRRMIREEIEKSKK